MARNALLAATIGVLLAVHHFFGITCPFLALFKIPCPTCGVTRAMLALLHLDFKAYAYYNPMAVFLCLAVVGMINLDFFPKKKPILVGSIVIVVINFGFWIIKLI